jgi:putative ABC transport system permease protein
MLSNYLSAAARNLSRNRLHTAITTASLAVGFAAALIAALLWRHETTFDRFWPNGDRLYEVAQWDWPGAREEGMPITSDATLSGLGPMARTSLPGVEAMTRLSVETLGLSRGQISSEEEVRWADANVFEIFPVKALEGDPSTALAAPNSIVLTKSLARKYFGDAPALGQTLAAGDFSRLNGRRTPLRVTAVIEDLPAKTHLEVAGFVSGVTAGSGLQKPLNRAYTYLLAKPGVSAEDLRRGLVALPPQPLEPKAKPHLVQHRPIAVSGVYLKPADYGKIDGGRASAYGMRSGSHVLLLFSAILGDLILGVAAINFITLMTARGAGRAVEVGVRKACGARRLDLVIQFMGEALVFAALALLAAFALVELLLPMVRVVTERQVALDYVADAGLVAGFAALALAVAAVAGLYPALALSAYRPAAVLKGGLAKAPGSARLRQVLVTLQFIPLVLLALMALSMGLLLSQAQTSARQMLKGDPLAIHEDCTPAFKAAIEAVPGVLSVSCASLESWRMSSTALGPNLGQELPRDVTASNGTKARLDVTEVSGETVRFHYGRAAYGRLFDEAGDDPSGVLINETAARALGYANPAAAVGQRLDLAARTGEQAAPLRSFTVLGVLADRWKPGFESAVYVQPGSLAPAAERQAQGATRGLGVRMTEANRPAILAAINRVWAQTGAMRPMNAAFYNDIVEERGAGNARVIRLLNIAVVVGMVVAALGLFGLAAFLAQQRTKEVGVRKAMGAGRGALLRMLLFQFVRPVVVANLVVCPLVLVFLWVMQRNLPLTSRFFIGPEIFGAVFAGSLLIALTATFTHAWRVTGAKPVAALRYE